MICAPIDTEATRFRVITIKGYPITARSSGSNAPLALVATVLDSFYGSEHGRFASTDRRRGDLRAGDPGYGPTCECGEPKSRNAAKCRRCGRGGYVGCEGALAAAEARCAELNAWHEREGWGEDEPLAARAGPCGYPLAGAQVRG